MQFEIIALIGIAMAVSFGIAYRKGSESIEDAFSLTSINLNKIGLDIFYSDSFMILPKDIHNPKVIFYHPNYNFRTPYSVVEKHAVAVQKSVLPLEQLIAYNRGKEANNLLRSMIKTAEEFKKEYSLDIDNQNLVPLLLIFGFKINVIQQALDSKIHPAILAAIVESQGDLFVLKHLAEIKNMPFEWLANMYDMKYTIRENSVR